MKTPLIPAAKAPQQQATIKLPPARTEQLRKLASIWGLSVADTVGRLLQGQIEAGVLPAEIPGVKIRREGDTVQIGFDDAEPVILTLAAATELAHSIRVRAGVSDLAAGAFEFLERQWPDPGLSPTRVDRRGTAVNVRVGEVRKSFAFSLATELADLIEAATA